MASLYSREKGGAEPLGTRPKAPSKWLHCDENSGARRLKPLPRNHAILGKARFVGFPGATQLNAKSPSGGLRKLLLLQLPAMSLPLLSSQVLGARPIVQKHKEKENHSPPLFTKRSSLSGGGTSPNGQQGAAPARRVSLQRAGRFAPGRCDPLRPRWGPGVGRQDELPLALVQAARVPLGSTSLTPTTAWSFCVVVRTPTSCTPRVPRGLGGPPPWEVCGVPFGSPGDRSGPPDSVSRLNFLTRNLRWQTW